jgi:hypothetical protein
VPVAKIVSRGRFLSAAVTVALASGAAAAWGAESGRSEGAIPDFSGVWQHGVPGVVFEYPPDGGYGPVMDVQWLGCLPNCRPRPPGTPFVGDSTNPILKPHAAEAVRRVGEAWRNGEIINSATEMCMPNGVPNIISILGPVQMLQTPKEVTILYGRDAQVRHIHLDQPHSPNPKPGWYGESVGHYEGDTLVVDTTGLNDKSLIDRFGTPQTETTHVVERYRLINEGQTLYVTFTVTDPATFNYPWSGAMRYTRVANMAAPQEEVCAENNRGVPLPTDDTPDF